MRRKNLILFALIFFLFGFWSAKAQDQSLVAHWSMNEGSGNMIFDDSGYGNDGIIYGANWIQYGVDGSALYFDGIDDYVEVPYDDSYNNISDLTISVWIRAMVLKGDIISRNGYPGGYPRSWAFSPLNFWAIRVGSYRYSEAISENLWHHMVVTYHYRGSNNSQVRLYLDGSLHQSWNNAGGPIAKNSQVGIRIGAHSWGSYVERFFKGVIDEVSIYRTALTSAQVNELYNEFIPDDPPHANAGVDQIVLCSSGDSKEVVLDGSGSFDPEGSPISYNWYWRDGTATGVSPTIDLPIGTTRIKLIVNDGKANSLQDFVNVTVVDISTAKWKYRLPITIDNTNNSNALANYQLLLILNTQAIVAAGKMQANCADIRFANDKGDPLAFWIESGVNTATTKIWVKVNSIPASSTATIYMYYGNPDAILLSNGDATFEFFDDFEGSNLDTNKWYHQGDEHPNAWIEVEGSDLHLRTYGSPWDAPGISVCSVFPVMKPPLVVEHLGNLFLNTGYDVNIHWGVIYPSPSPLMTGVVGQIQFTYDFHGSVGIPGSGEEVFRMRNPQGRFRDKIVVHPDGTVGFYIDDTFKGLSNLKLPTDITFDASFGLMWKTDYKCDKIFFRKYASPEPTFVLGEEEPTNSPPLANAGPDQTLECTSCCATEVTLDGTGSSDPDGDPLTYKWTWNSGSATGATPTITLPLGTTTIKLVVNDGQVDSEPDYVDITIQDTTPPEISVTVDPYQLWPPNHKMVDIQATVSVSDVCDENPAWQLLSVTSNEPEAGPGKKNSPDIMGAEIGTSDTEFQLRAERFGNGSGRVYTIVYEATDAAGNSATAEAQVVVPHDLGKRVPSPDGVDQSAPLTFKLEQNYPNPFNAETHINFQIAESRRVTIAIYDVNGRMVRSLYSGLLERGNHSVIWDSRDNFQRDVPSGVYFVKMNADGLFATKKIILLR